MLTFHPIEFLIVVIAGGILVAGLSLLALRRRNEILQDYLTPEDPNIETEFFKQRPVAQVESQDKLSEAAEKSEDAPETPVDTATWGTPD